METFAEDEKLGQYSMPTGEVAAVAPEHQYDDPSMLETPFGAFALPVIQIFTNDGERYRFRAASIFP